MGIEKINFDQSLLSMFKNQNWLLFAHQIKFTLLPIVPMTQNYYMILFTCQYADLPDTDVRTEFSFSKATH